MEKEIILIKDVEGLGKEGDVVNVVPGYARNYLFPQGMAAPATPKHIKMLEMERKRRETHARKAVEKLKALAEELGKKSITVAVQAGEDGKLFGSVTTHQIADAIREAGLDIDRKKIDFPEPIKELGVYSIEIKLHQEAVATVKVWVVAK